MAFCANCGGELREGAKFCEFCGTAVPQAAPVVAEKETPVQTIPTQTPPQQDAYQPPQTESGADRRGIPAPGYSDRVNDPEILAAMKKNKKATRIFAAILIPLPLVGCVIYSFVSNKMELQEAVKYGAIISFIFLLCTLFSTMKQKTAKPYEAVVTEKKTRERSDHNQEHAHYYTEYITVAKTDDGKKKKIVENRIPMAYDYLEIGDRFKYHPQFNFPYEHYDKSRAPYIACVSCGTKNDITNDRCERCHIPLLK